MSINTAAKRASVLGVAVVAVLAIVSTGGGQAEQQTNCHCYSGIIASRPVAPLPDPPHPDANYDVIDAIDVLMPGVVVQHNLIDAAWSAYQAKGFLPLVAADVAGILAAAGYPALPVYPKGLVRLSDSNEASDGWARDIGSLP